MSDVYWRSFDSWAAAVTILRNNSRDVVMIKRSRLKKVDRKSVVVPDLYGGPPRPKFRGVNKLTCLGKWTRKSIPTRESTDQTTLSSNVEATLKIEICDCRTTFSWGLIDPNWTTMSAEYLSSCHTHAVSLNGIQQSRYVTLSTVLTLNGSIWKQVLYSIGWPVSGNIMNQHSHERVNQPANKPTSAAIIHSRPENVGYSCRELFRVAYNPVTTASSVDWAKRHNE